MQMTIDRFLSYCPEAQLKNHAIFDTSAKLCRNIYIFRLVISLYSAKLNFPISASQQRMKFLHQDPPQSYLSSKFAANLCHHSHQSPLAVTQLQELLFLSSQVITVVSSSIVKNVPLKMRKRCVAARCKRQLTLRKIFRCIRFRSLARNAR